MLHLLDQALETFLRSTLPSELREIDVAFDAPDGDWGAGLTRPTVNLFLRDVRRNLAERSAGRQLADHDGQRVWQVPPPRADCRYVVTAWTSEVDDEHRLLGEVLTVLLRASELPSEHLPDALRTVPPPPSLTVAASGGDDQADFWSALGGQLKPGLDLTVTATVDTAATREAGAEVVQAGVGIVDLTTPRRSDRRTVAGRAARDTAGCVVRSPRGHAVVGDDGRFVIRADVGDEVVVESDPPARGVVPESGAVTPRRRR